MQVEAQQYSHHRAVSQPPAPTQGLPQQHAPVSHAPAGQLRRLCDRADGQSHVQSRTGAQHRLSGGDTRRGAKWPRFDVDLFHFSRR